MLFMIARRAHFYTGNTNFHVCKRWSQVSSNMRLGLSKLRNLGKDEELWARFRQKAR